MYFLYFWIRYADSANYLLGYFGGTNGNKGTYPRQTKQSSNRVLQSRKENFWCTTGRSEIREKTADAPRSGGDTITLNSPPPYRFLSLRVAASCLAVSTPSFPTSQLYVSFFTCFLPAVSTAVVLPTPRPGPPVVSSSHLDPDGVYNKHRRYKATAVNPKYNRIKLQERDTNYKA